MITNLEILYGKLKAAEGIIDNIIDGEFVEPAKYERLRGQIILLEHEIEVKINEAKSRQE